MDKQGNKTGGRQKGTPNKKTGEIRDMISRILEYVDTAITIPALIDEVYGSDKAKILDFIRAVAPKTLDLGGQKDNPVMVVTPKTKELMDKMKEEEDGKV